MVCINMLLLCCSSVHREGLKTIQQVVEMACQGNVEGYLQLTDHIIQQIKCTDKPHLKDVGTHSHSGSYNRSSFSELKLVNMLNRDAMSRLIHWEEYAKNRRHRPNCMYITCKILSSYVINTILVFPDLQRF